MVPVTVEYLGQLKTRCTHGPSSTTAVTAAPADNAGDGSSFSPTDLVATALATCVLTTIAIAARKHGIEIDGASASVEKHMSAEAPRRIARLPVEVRLPASVPPEMRERLERAGEACPVKRSLHPDIEATLTYRWA